MNGVYNAEVLLFGLEDVIDCMDLGDFSRRRAMAAVAAVLTGGVATVGYRRHRRFNPGSVDEFDFTWVDEEPEESVAEDHAFMQEVESGEYTPVVSGDYGGPEFTEDSDVWRVEGVLHWGAYELLQ